MIIEEIDSLKQLEIEKEELRKLLKLNLPKNYRLNWIKNTLYLEKKSFLLWYEIGWLHKVNENIIVYFQDKEEFEELRESFEKSPNKFIIKFEDFY